MLLQVQLHDAFANPDESAPLAEALGQQHFDPIPSFVPHQASPSVFAV